jgi:hypothetical protein
MAQVIRLPSDPAIEHPSEVLGSIIGSRPTTYYEAIEAVYLYADGRSLVADGVLTCDSELAALFAGSEQVKLPEIPALVAAELTSTGEPANESPIAYLFTWNPRKFLWESLKDDIGMLTESGYAIFDWSCGRSRKPGLGDRVFLLRQGVDPKGIVGSGVIISQNHEATLTEDAPKQKAQRENYVTVEWEAVIDGEKEAPLGRLVLKERFPGVNWDTQVSGIRIPDQDAEELEEVWGDHLCQLGYELEEPEAPPESGA